MKINKINKLSFGLALICAQMSVAQETLTLETIRVQTEKSSNPFRKTWDKKAIASTPKGNASLDGLLQTQPSIQFSSGGLDNSEQLGEIAPAYFSVHGESFYNNQLAIDGLSNNAALNPSHNGTNPIPDADTINNHTPNQLPSGHAQGFWISNQLVDRIKVMDSNIPAQYGRFTGGYIDAELLQPQLKESSGSISYRQTRDKWVHFYLDENYEETFKKSLSPDTQPQFLKQQFHLDINQPIGEKSALLFAYNREESKIPLYHQYLKERHIQRRLAENYYLKAIHQLDENNEFSASVLYSPHKALYFPENIKEGSYQDIGGGWRLHFNWDSHQPFGEMNTQIAYRQIQEKTAYEKQNLYRYQGNTPNIPWVSFADTEEATLGGLGTTKIFQDELTLKQRFEFNPIHHQSFSQNWSAGWQINYARAGIERENDSRIYAGAAPTDKMDCTDCITGEQYFTWLAHIHAIKGKVPNTNAAIWAENQLLWDKLQLNLGLRADYNQFLKNINIAPRISFKKELGDKGYYLSGGLNRYYGAEILTYKLASHFKDQDNYNRHFDDPNPEWKGKPHYFLGYHGSTLKTPYSDEVNLSFGQETDDFHWQAKWVQRNSRQQFMTHRYEDDEGRVVRELNNSGRNKHNTLSLTFDSIRPWQLGKIELGLSAGLDYQHHKSNQQSHTYNESEWWNDYKVKLMVDGRFYEPKDMPALNGFNRPWGGYLATKMTIPDWHFTWEQRFRYEAPRKFYEQTNLRCKNAVKPEVKALCGDYTEGNLARYDSVHYSSSVLTDWHFSWDKPLSSGRSIELNLDIMNVFNRKIVGKKIITEAWQNKLRDVSYKSGRQFWAGFKYQW
ncbi:MAG: hypothetical protein Q4B71_06450 [Cardiobacteriaceae bacterium]|nr:hypothetical protein [Cardiobacteriaceae bacterium]